MKFGDEIRGTVTGYDEKGRGVFDQWTIPFAAIGDEIVGTFARRAKGRKIARLQNVTTASPDRVSAPCPHAGVCGGCLWQHLDYDAQIRIKREMINAAFANAGHEERVADITPCPNALNYRNRMDYAIGWKGEIGLKEYGSWNRYVDLSTCLLLDEETPQIIETTRELMRELNLEPWDAKRHTGLMRYLVIRLGRNTNQRMVMLVVSDATKIDASARRIITDRLGPLATSLLIGEQPKITDISYIERVESLKGEPWLEEEVNGVRYRLAPNSFFQTNTRMAGKLQDVVLSEIQSTCHSTVQPGNLQYGDPPVKPWDDSSFSKHVLDLYCGLGFFGISAAKRFPGIRVSGFEIDAEAIALAKHNAEANGVADRCEFASGPAEDLSWQNIDADVVILDPPRAGLHPRVIETVLAKKPQTIIYVSCNFHRFVEELKEFKRDYRVESIQALDLFPQTPHVEVVTKLTRIT